MFFHGLISNENCAPAPFEGQHQAVSFYLLLMPESWVSLGGPRNTSGWPDSVLSRGSEQLSCRTSSVSRASQFKPAASTESSSLLHPGPHRKHERCCSPHPSDE